MCGRYTLVVERERIESRFDARFSERFSPRYNAAPGQRLPVITNDAPASIDFFEWGLVPAWASNDRGGHVNARAETLTRRPSFEEAAVRRRALVPADGFYEWAATDDGTQPYRIAFEDERLFAMAGLWERWEPDTLQTGLGRFSEVDSTGSRDDDRSARPLETFTIVTTEPNEVVGALHHRMAAILSPEDERRWLTGDLAPSALDPIDGDGLRASPVSRAVNDPTADRASLLEPVPEHDGDRLAR
ncbi:MAG: SOS response-associated peptidase [Halobacteriota archaeon]